MNLKLTFNLMQNMGARYVSFRMLFELKRKLGLLKKEYPTQPELQQFITLEQWKANTPAFFLAPKEQLNIPVLPIAALKQEAEAILAGKHLFFSAECFDLGKDYDWITNPDTGYKYNINTHWTEVNDYSKEAGDIKYVWEKSRFSYLHTLIRYDHHFKQDMSAFVFAEIESWIDHNPVNQGPNYKCSQETSLRLMNWTLALYYYKNSISLTEVLFQKIIHAIYWQTKHVYSNIDFSRIAVRNNHAITETLDLYFVGLLYPFFPEAEKWKIEGKRWFEEEIAYQVYKDGTFLQFSMNYHRVVIQLLTWAVRINSLHDKPFKDVVYDRAKASLKFLSACMNDENGMLPNYGANDGALFFKFNNNEFRDYRPQLEALAAALGIAWQTNTFEDKYWYGCAQVSAEKKQVGLALSSFNDGGYYIIKDENSLSFIRCGSYKDRPSHADNLHLDLWVNGENIMRDAGSYKYNTDEETLRYFFGTSSHNTVMLEGYDQMLKGSRFIWYYWSQALGAGLKEYDEYVEFTGTIQAFHHVGKYITHTRKVRKYKNKLRWEIEDELKHNTPYAMLQIWNPAPDFLKEYNIAAFSKDGGSLSYQTQPGWYSGLYGKKESTEKLVFKTQENYIKTVIESKA